MKARSARHSTPTLYCEWFNALHHEFHPLGEWIGAFCHKLMPAVHRTVIHYQSASYATSRRQKQPFVLGLVSVSYYNYQNCYNPLHLIRQNQRFCHLSRCDSVTDWLWQFTGLSFTTNPPLCYLKEKAWSRPTDILHLITTLSPPSAVPLPLHREGISGDHAGKAPTRIWWYVY